MILEHESTNLARMFEKESIANIIAFIFFNLLLPPYDIYSSFGFAYDQMYSCTAAWVTFNSSPGSDWNLTYFTLASVAAFSALCYQSWAFTGYAMRWPLRKGFRNFIFRCTTFISGKEAGRSGRLQFRLILLNLVTQDLLTLYIGFLALYTSAIPVSDFVQVKMYISGVSISLTAADLIFTGTRKLLGARARNILYYASLVTFSIMLVLLVSVIPLILIGTSILEVDIFNSEISISNQKLYKMPRNAVYNYSQIIRIPDSAFTLSSITNPPLSTLTPGFSTLVPYLSELSPYRVNNCSSTPVTITFPYAFQIINYNTKGLLQGDHCAKEPENIQPSNATGCIAYPEDANVLPTALCHADYFTVSPISEDIFDSATTWKGINWIVSQLPINNVPVHFNGFTFLADTTNFYFSFSEVTITPIRKCAVISSNLGFESLTFSDVLS